MQVRESQLLELLGMTVTGLRPSRPVAAVGREVSSRSSRPAEGGATVPPMGVPRGGRAWPSLLPPPGPRNRRSTAQLGDPSRRSRAGSAEVGGGVGSGAAWRIASSRGSHWEERPWTLGRYRPRRGCAVQGGASPVPGRKGSCP